VEGDVSILEDGTGDLSNPRSGKDKLEEIQLLKG
jgi:hypothetical protein